MVRADFRVQSHVTDDNRVQAEPIERSQPLEDKRIIVPARLILLYLKSLQKQQKK